MLSDGAGWRAGLDAGDEIVALDGFRASSAADLAKRVWPRRAGDTLALSVFRRDELLTLPVQLDAIPAAKAKLARVASPTAAQEAAWAGWMGQHPGESPPDARGIAAQGD